jgi:hypothetical protein
MFRVLCLLQKYEKLMTPKKKNHLRLHVWMIKSKNLLFDYEFILMLSHYLICNVKCENSRLHYCDTNSS